MRPSRLLGQGADYCRLLSLAEQGRLPHGVLVCGGRGLGKTTAALELASVLLEHDPRVQTRAHPDLHVVEVPEDREEIPVELVRLLREELLRKPMAGGARVAILEPADRLNEQGQNALLKTLEEPGRRSFLLLATRRPEAMLPTVRSRVTLVRLRPVAPAQMSPLLAEESQGKPAEHVAWAVAVAHGSVGVARELLAHSEELVPIYRQLVGFVARPEGAVALAKSLLHGVTGRAAAVRRAQLVLFLVRQITRSCAFSEGLPQALGALGEGCGELHSTLAARGLGPYAPEALLAWTPVLDRLLVAEEDLELKLAPEPVLAAAFLDLADTLGSLPTSHP